MARKEHRPKPSKSSRKTFARILIVGEGKTEESYFNFIKNTYGPIQANIEIFASTSPQPEKILEFTNEKIEEAVSNPYVHVFCVFDRDDNLKFNETCQKMTDANYTLARSWPCFEYWILLHFEDTRPYFRDCNECCERIKRKKHMPEYKKGDIKMLQKFINKAKIETAIARGLQSCEQADSTSTPATRTDANNTSTEVYRVVKCLKTLSEQKQNPSAS